MTIRNEGEHLILFSRHKTLLTRFTNRYYDVHCHDDNDYLNSEGLGCLKGSSVPPVAHTVPKDSNHNNYDVIVLCDKWFEFTPFREKVKRMDDPNTPYPRDNLLSLKTQGATNYVMCPPDQRGFANKM